MKIVTLNTWGGRAGKEGLLNFFRTYKGTVDIFCLQEMWSGSYEHLGSYTAGGVQMDTVSVMTEGVQDISTLLDAHQSFFHPHHLGNYGLLILCNKALDVREYGEVFVHKHKDYKPKGDVGLHARNIQFAKFEHKGTPYTVMNFHGLWNGKGKTDSEDRILQSQKIVEFVQAQKGEVIFCGDFNLLPDTQSIKMLEDAGLRNLVTEYGVTSTRTSLYKKSEKFADYIFVSKGVEILDFKVLPEEVSDHAALYLEIA